MTNPTPSAEERGQKLMRVCIDYWQLDDPEFEDNFAMDCAGQIRQAEQAAYERAARLHENIDPACDHERQNGDPGAGAMGAVIEYRDKIRALAKDSEPGEAA